MERGQTRLEMSLEGPQDWPWGSSSSRQREGPRKKRDNLGPAFTPTLSEPTGERPELLSSWTCPPSVGGRDGGCTYHRGGQARGSSPREPRPWGLQMPVLGGWRVKGEWAGLFPWSLLPGLSGAGAARGWGLAMGRRCPAGGWRVLWSLVSEGSRSQAGWRRLDCPRQPLLAPCHPE